MWLRRRRSEKNDKFGPTLVKNLPSAAEGGRKKSYHWSPGSKTPLPLRRNLRWAGFLASAARKNSIFVLIYSISKGKSCCFDLKTPKFSCPRRKMITLHHAYQSRRRHERKIWILVLYRGKNRAVGARNFCAFWCLQQGKNCKKSPKILQISPVSKYPLLTPREDVKVLSDFFEILSSVPI